MLEQTEPGREAGLASSGPLSRFKVLDLTHARSGPSCVRTLADWGADVIRIEQPPAAEELDEVVGKRDGSDFQNLHRNKRALTLNLKSDAGKRIFYKLAAGADVIVENMRPGVAKRLGVDFEAVQAINPRIVYGSISGFGQYGPYAERPSLDQVAQGMSGIMSITGLPGDGPVRVGIAVTDLVAGAFLAQGLLVALLDREVTGKGRWVQTSLIEAGIALLDFQATRWLMKKDVATQEGNFHPTVTPTGLYATSDGYLNLSASGNRIFRKFAGVIGQPQLATDPRFNSSEARARNRAELNRLIGEVLKSKTSREWFEAMIAENIPCGPVYHINDVFSDPQVKELRIARPVRHPRLGDIELVAQPFEITGYDRGLRTATPSLGQHNDEILTGLGFDSQEIGSLREQRVI
ncbi:CaiB/BaiF CoA-transferase family protein [Bradyrhizobium sp. LHD-71]|uniref:CaiB/BaiF CoA transferase family protein n=1 Tax=Bradyrhizobium sp. LHD-71 TaxID=3072141 RepID=UPI0028103507|nr:CaiB/BaiF CoA-transferase family protein [Bradyrhizobium sp. LHD-71]MDQ8729754.1 CaiB/BaiF CoA-transferase family protein [Bradyrhizobium sp. LHD-71]